MPVLLAPIVQVEAAQSAPAPQQKLFTADALNQRCGATDAQSVTACFTFIAAVVDTSRAYQQWLNFREFCLPANVSQGELRRAALRYIDVHRHEGDAQAASVVVLALKDAYPCAVSITRPSIAPDPSPTPPAPATAPPAATSDNKPEPGAR